MAEPAQTQTPSEPQRGGRAPAGFPVMVGGGGGPPGARRGPEPPCRVCVLSWRGSCAGRCLVLRVWLQSPRVSEVRPATAHGTAVQTCGLIRPCPSTFLSGWWGVQASSTWQGPSLCRARGHRPGPVSVSCAAVPLSHRDTAPGPGYQGDGGSPRGLGPASGQGSGQQGSVPPTAPGHSGTWRTVPGKLGWKLAEASAPGRSKWLPLVEVLKPEKDFSPNFCFSHFTKLLKFVTSSSWRH